MAGKKMALGRGLNALIPEQKKEDGIGLDAVPLPSPNHIGIADRTMISALSIIQKRQLWIHDFLMIYLIRRQSSLPLISGNQTNNDECCTLSPGMMIDFSS